MAAGPANAPVWPCGMHRNRQCCSATEHWGSWGAVSPWRVREENGQLPGMEVACCCPAGGWGREIISSLALWRGAERRNWRVEEEKNQINVISTKNIYIYFTLCKYAASLETLLSLFLVLLVSAKKPNAWVKHSTQTHLVSPAAPKMGI